MMTIIDSKGQFFLSAPYTLIRIFFLHSFSFSQFYFYSSPTGKFCMHFCRLLIFFKIICFEKLFHEYHQSDSLDPDLAQRFVAPDLGPKLFPKVIS